MQNCGECGDVPCKIWFDTRDPKFSDEEFSENLRIYGSLEDFFTLTDYPGFDPEVTGVGNSLGVDKGSYPNSKKVVLGLSVTF